MYNYFQILHNSLIFRVFTLFEVPVSTEHINKPFKLQQDEGMTLRCKLQAVADHIFL